MLGTLIRQEDPARLFSGNFPAVLPRQVPHAYNVTEG
jgi:hypothetical protein